MKNERSPARRAVENALKKATEPVCADELALRVGLHPDTVRSHLSNMRNLGLARNTQPGRRTACYLWNDDPVPAPPPEPVRVNEPRSCLTMGTLKPVRMIAVRDGSEDFKDVPTVRNGIAHPHVRPMILASSAVSLPKST